MTPTVIGRKCLNSQPEGIGKKEGDSRWMNSCNLLIEEPSAPRVEDVGIYPRSISTSMKCHNSGAVECSQLTFVCQNDSHFFLNKSRQNRWWVVHVEAIAAATIAAHASHLSQWTQCFSIWQSWSNHESKAWRRHDTIRCETNVTGIVVTSLSNNRPRSWVVSSGDWSALLSAEEPRATC